MRKHKAECYLKMLMSISLAVGKFRFKLQRSRTKKALNVLSRIVPYVGRFLRARRFYFSSIITFMLELSLTHGLMTRMMLARRQKVIPTQLLVIQREWRKAFSYRRALYAMLRVRWSLAENELNSTRSKSKANSRKSKRSKEDVHKRPYTIPNEVKDYYLRQHILSLTRKFSAEWQQHKMLVSQGENSSPTDTLIRLEASKSEIEILPKLSLYVSDQTLKEIIRFALEERIDWRVLQSRFVYLTQNKPV